VTLYEALDAADMLATEGITITVIDAYSVKPLAADVIREAAGRTGHAVLTVEDHYPEGGLGEAVAGELSPEGFMVFRLAVPQLPHSGKSEELLARYGLDAASIRGKVHEIIHRIETRSHPAMAGTVD
jgi:transketolase